MEVAQICESTNGTSGAVVVTVLFLSLFVVLLVFDGLVSFFALQWSLSGSTAKRREMNTELEQLNRDIQTKRQALKRLGEMANQEWSDRNRMWALLRVHAYAQHGCGNGGGADGGSAEVPP